MDTEELLLCSLGLHRVDPNEARMNKILTGSRVVIGQERREPFDFRNVKTLYMSTGHMPKPDSGFWRRMKYASH